MEAKEIVFDKHLEVQVALKSLNNEVRLVLSDGLYASEQELTNEYLKKIATFINDLPQWYDKACRAVFEWARNTYKIDTEIQDLQLQSIFILFEQNEDELFGLSFRVEFDIEHGCGIKIRVDNGKFEIVEVGTGDVAFC